MANTIVDQASGVVQEPELHDAVLTGISLEKPTIRLSFRAASGRSILVTFTGVFAVMADSLVEENIVFEMLTLPVAAAPPDDVRRALRRGPGEGVDPSLLHRLQHDGYVMVRIDPVVGMDAVILCRRIDWEDTG
jgi:hypothetical protein